MEPTTSRTEPQDRSWVSPVCVAKLVIVVAYLAAVVFLTMGPHPALPQVPVPTAIDLPGTTAPGSARADARSLTEAARRTVNAGLVEETANVALFAPGGALVALWLRRRPRRARIVILGATATVALYVLATETVQLTLATWRQATLTDLVTGTTGGLLGSVLAAALPARLLPPPCRFRPSTPAG